MAARLFAKSASKTSHFLFEALFRPCTAHPAPADNLHSTQRLTFASRQQPYPTDRVEHFTLTTQFEQSWLTVVVPLPVVALVIVAVATVAVDVDAAVAVVAARARRRSGSP